MDYNNPLCIKTGQGPWLPKQESFKSFLSLKIKWNGEVWVPMVALAIYSLATKWRLCWWLLRTCIMTSCVNMFNAIQYLRGIFVYFHIKKGKNQTTKCLKFFDYWFLSFMKNNCSRFCAICFNMQHQHTQSCKSNMLHVMQKRFNNYC